MHLTTGITYILYYIHVGYYRDYHDKSLDYHDITFSIIAQHHPSTQCIIIKMHSVECIIIAQSNMILPSTFNE